MVPSGTGWCVHYTRPVCKQLVRRTVGPVGDGTYSYSTDDPFHVWCLSVRLLLGTEWPVRQWTDLVVVGWTRPRAVQGWTLLSVEMVPGPFVHCRKVVFDRSLSELLNLCIKTLWTVTPLICLMFNWEGRGERP